FRISILIFSVIGFCLSLFPLENFMSLINYFAYFTNQSNLFVMIYLIVMITLSVNNLIQKNYTVPTIKPILHLFVVFCITATMLIFTGLTIYAILNNAFIIIAKNTIHGISAIIFHYVVPISIIIDYIKFAPHGKITIKSAKDFCFFTLIYFLAIVLRAQTRTLMHNDPQVNYFSYYPYPFVDIEKLGLIKSLVSLTTSLTFFYVFSVVLILIDQNLSKRQIKS
ncbi:MAG: Pr6Pr family membrane protein, partial [Clostridiales bacterium]|nr:Pr6Pr family membrane protein [Candidatus Apopatousia equi]